MHQNGDTPFGPGIDPEQLAVALEVLERVEALPVDHPDAVAVRRATGRIFKTLKERRRAARKAATQANDRVVLAATATAAPGRIDDETRGIPISGEATGARAGTLLRARPCYVCKAKYTAVDAFYHQLCPRCARDHHERREATADLAGRRALLTGGRAKIGMYIALRLLRDGAHTTITTRFPNDAARRFAQMSDSDDWMHRLRICGIDLRDPGQVVELADSVARQGPLDILINNAAQTVRRSPDAYSALVSAESAPLPAGPLPETTNFGLTRDAHPALLAGALDESRLSGENGAAAAAAAAALTAQALTARSPDIDAGGLLPDVTDINSWTQTVEEVNPIEMLEVQLCNVTAPFILVSRLRGALKAAGARRKYVVNVSAMEGSFGRGYKGPGHPHTNMAKAALNMLTRTSAKDFFDDGILMTSVDTGWITDERPHNTKARLAAEGFHAPLDLIDGAARVYDPIIQGEAGVDLYGCFLKDFEPTTW